MLIGAGIHWYAHSFLQVEMIAAYGRTNLSNGWESICHSLTELKTKSTPRKIAAIFLDELLRNGTTTGTFSFCSRLSSVCWCFFLEWSVWCTSAWLLVQGNDGIETLQIFRYTLKRLTKKASDWFQKWHKKGRWLYAKLRFAIASTDEQLQGWKVVDRISRCFIYTHFIGNHQWGWVG